ncbi:hypothetical protein [Sphingobium amiense]|uniref:hypothetical protein n=1 Tax=Sphingobium amiense TaxID=135719 RepID=UPI000A654C4E|nr:hypothetical protein [Sphingobium amiense]
MTMQSSLGRHASSMRDPDPAAARRLARQAFHETGFIVLDPAWIQSWGDRELVKAIAAKVHGKAKK